MNIGNARSFNSRISYCSAYGPFCPGLLILISVCLLVYRFFFIFCLLVYRFFLFIRLSCFSFFLFFHVCLFVHLFPTHSYICSLFFLFTCRNYCIYQFSFFFSLPVYLSACPSMYLSPAILSLSFFLTVCLSVSPSFSLCSALRLQRRRSRGEPRARLMTIYYADILARFRGLPVRVRAAR